MMGPFMNENLARFPIFPNVGILRERRYVIGTEMDVETALSASTVLDRVRTLFGPAGIDTHVCFLHQLAG